MNDKEVLRKLKAGDEETFLRLVRENHGVFTSLARNYVKTKETAEEIVQETWMAVLKGIDRFEGRSTLKTWMFGILCNLARTRAKREHRTILFSEVGGEDEPGKPAVDPSRFKASGYWNEPPRPWDDHTPERLAHNSEMMEHLKEAIKELPDTQRAVVALRDIAGLSSGEACNVLGLSETNQRVLLHRGRARLRGMLEDIV